MTNNSKYSTITRKTQENKSRWGTILKTGLYTLYFFAVFFAIN
ncbi:hypothetical protein AVV23_gp39 [Paenibacillus phage Sitara]|uniref:Uncharacterized protein n=1 Tax=Paenibacillus phage Sitara TaxID=1589755 RepID=A0A0C5AFA8_9CAUD|nr:hypothetical protein AVV23_gp39 [Paenibacillus phage Sitara]AJK28027.1 hypothetical protein SITARA_39 [Paenibacillus phage Sitara]